MAFQKKKAEGGDVSALDPSQQAIQAQTEGEGEPAAPTGKGKGKGKAAPTPVVLPPGARGIDRLLASDLLKKLRKDMGDKVIVSARDFKDETQKVPTGIFPLDYALGGGFPIGRITTVYGRKSAGKTTSIIRALAHAQRMCATCWRLHDEIPSECECGEYREPAIAYIDVEGAFDKKWAQTLGLDLDRMMISRPQVAEEGIDVLDALLRSGECDFAVLDSIAFLVPMKEQEESVEDNTPAMQARLVGKMIRKVVSGSIGVQRATGRQPTVFLVNQIREKVGVMFGSPETTPGGNAPGFASSIELKCQPAKYEQDPETGRPLWGDFGFKIEKNKLAGTVKMEGTYRMYLSDSISKRKGEINDEGYVIREAERVGLITGAGSHWKALGEDFSAKSLIEKRMLTDRDFSKAIRVATMKVLLSTM